MTIWQENIILHNQIIALLWLLGFSGIVILALSVWVWIKYRLASYVIYQIKEKLISMGVARDSLKLITDPLALLQIAFDRGFHAGVVQTEYDYEKQGAAFKAGKVSELQHLKDHQAILNNRPNQVEDVVKIFGMVETLRKKMGVEESPKQLTPGDFVDIEGVEVFDPTEVQL